MTALIQRLGVLSLTSSAVLLPLLLLSPRIQKRYAAKSLYVLWLLLAVRLLLPVELTLPRPAVTIQVPQVAYTVPVSPVRAPVAPVAPAAPPVPVTVPAAPAAVHAAPTVTLGQLLFGVWLAGAVLFLGWNAVGCALARRDLLKGAREELGDQLLLAKLWEGEHGRPAVLRSCRTAGAMSLGLFHPVVVLPEGLEPGRETEMVLRHELGHILRRDLWYKFLLVLCNAAHWFNPLVWLMCRQAGRNLEYCCDDWVVRGQDADFRHSYGQVLLRHAAGRGLSPLYATRFSGGGQLKGRIVNLFTVKRTGAALVALALCAAMIAGMLVSCESGQAKEGATYTQKTCGFTLRLPESWEGRFKAVDTTRVQTKFYLDGDETVLLVTMLCVPLDQYPDYFPPEGERAGYRLRELGPVGERMVVLLDYASNYPEEGNAERDAMVEELWNLGPAALETDDPVYENEEYGFTLRLPKSWEGRFEATADESGYITFRDTEVGAEGGIFGLTIYPGPQEAMENSLTARTFFLGGREGCGVRLDMWQSFGPTQVQVTAEALERYNTMYDDLLRWLDAAPASLLTFRDGGAAPDVEASPALTAQQALDELETGVIVTDDELAFTVPMGYPVPSDWKLQASGRYQDTGMSMSVHIVDNDGKQPWEAGKTYRFPLTEYDLSKFTELTLNAWLPDGQGGELEKEVDLLARAELIRAQGELLDQFRELEAGSDDAVQGAEIMLDVVVNDTSAMLSEMAEARPGAVMPQIDYTSENMLIFHDYWGLGVYDRASRQLVRVADTPSIGMDLMQGDRTTQVQLSADGKIVRLENAPDADGRCWFYLLDGDAFYEVSAVADFAAAPAGDLNAEAEARKRGVTPDGSMSNFALTDGGTLCYLRLTEGTMDKLELVEVSGEGEAQTYPVYSVASAAAWQWPLPGLYQVSAYFGKRVHPLTGAASDHGGIDIPAPEGTPVLAAQAGTVLANDFNSTQGNYVLLGDGVFTTCYACLQSSAVEEGDTVQAGQVVGYVGSTGESTGDHLHLEFSQNGVAVDPLNYYPDLRAAPGAVIDVRCDGGRYLIGSSSFTAAEGQTLALTYTTDAADGGKVDLYLFGPDGAQRHLSFVKGSETREIELPVAGTWAYNCTGSSLSVCTASLVGTLS